MLLVECPQGQLACQKSCSNRY